jgi:protein-ribulosamine 3-kinase
MKLNEADNLEFGAGNTRVDPAVLRVSRSTSISLQPDLRINCLQALPEGCKVVSTEKHGISFWARTGRIHVSLMDGTTKSFFIKVISNEHGKKMVLGEFESMTAIHNTLPQFVPKPIAWGPYTTISDTYFFLCAFRDMTHGMPNPHQFAALLSMLHQKSISPTGKFGFHITTCAGNPPEFIGW